MSRREPLPEAPRSRLRLYAWCALAITVASVATVLLTERGAEMELPADRATFSRTSGNALEAVARN